MSREQWVGWAVHALIVWALASTAIAVGMLAVWGARRGR